MTVVGHPAFWLALLASFSALTGVGLTLAYALIPDPPTYHRTPFMEFALPHGFVCDQEGTETVCQPSGQGPHPAIIIFAAKLRSSTDEDSLDAYLAHLRTPRNMRTPDGESYVSEVRHAKSTQLGQRVWADGLHLGSEIQGYYTRYLGTVTAHLGIVITYSVHSDHYEHFDAAFRDSITNLVTQQRVSAFD